MAKIETTFIRPKELYTPETGETKVVYDGYQNNPHELVVEENLEGEVSEIVNDTFVPNEGGNVVFTDVNDVAHELITKSGLGKAQVIETTWQELKDKRDNGQLIAGSLYRITDYQCTTTQENTQSAGHQFDIVLLALSEDKLAEEGWAMMHDNDVYDITFEDGVTKKCYFTPNFEGHPAIIDVETLLGIDQMGTTDVTLDEENKTATCIYSSTDLDVPNITYNYFQNSNLSAWKVWYCLDNDTSRFAWADDADTPAIKDLEGYGVNVLLVRDSTKDNFDAYAWFNEAEDAILYTMSPIPKIGDVTYEEGDNELVAFAQVDVVQGFGRGVIYRLIDEFNNDIKYDFKNIQFKRTITDGQYDATNGTETWCYTLNVWYEDICQDASIVGNTLPNDEGYVKGVYDNVFGYTTVYDFSIEGADTFAFALGDNVVLSFDDAGYYVGIKSNTVGNSFNSNTIGNGFSSNTIGNHFGGNIIGNDFASNTIGNAFNNKTISDSTWYKNYGNNGVELATKNDIGNIETALNNI